ncbi:MalY/PatB family protein [Ferrimonas senticii]|uniref:MalY/PatB family protein n=1 Tax=Ferrimonas senticii TaxID=394566 RepID=UPI0003FF7657|nr:PatB family C-S lyase [Ferrimonas senticii]
MTELELQLSPFQTLIDRHHGDSLKWNRFDAKVLPMWVADMDFAIAPAIQAAIAARTGHPLYGYAEVDQALLDAAVSWLSKRWDWQVNPKHLVALPAVVPGLNFAVRALAEPKRLAWPNPVYGPIAKVAEHLGLEGGTFAVSAEHGWDLAELETQLKLGAKVVLLCCPQNPIGRTFSLDEYQQLAALILRYDAWVVSDDIHGDLIFDGQRHLPLAKAVPQLAERVLTLFAAGKAFNIAGLPFAFAHVSNNDWRRRLQRALAGFAPAPNVLAMTASKAAWQHGESWLEELLETLQHNRELLRQAFADQQQVRLIIPQATYLAWFDCRALGWDSPAKVLREFGLGVSDGSEFGMAGFARLNFACPELTLQEGIARFKRAIAAYR